jgi:hypothetical protein
VVSCDLPIFNFFDELLLRLGTGKE